MNKKLSTLIRQYRKELSLTQQELAEIMNTSQSQVCKFEKGTLRPSLEHFARWYQDTDRQEVVWKFRLTKWLRSGKLD